MQTPTSNSTFRPDYLSSIYNSGNRTAENLVINDLCLRNLDDYS